MAAKELRLGQRWKGHNDVSKSHTLDSWDLKTPRRDLPEPCQAQSDKNRVLFVWATMAS